MNFEPEEQASVLIRNQKLTVSNRTIADNHIHLWARTAANGVLYSPFLAFPKPRIADLCAELLHNNPEQVWRLLAKLNLITPQLLADAMKRDIIADQRIPKGAKSFAELHDYMDANCLGGTEILFEEWVSPSGSDHVHQDKMDRLNAVMNPAMDIVDGWLSSGGLACARQK